MGVGYPVDLVVCVCLGVDMFDCVYATRTGRFGTALGRHGEMVLTREVYKCDQRVLTDGCRCETCARGITRAYLNALFREGEPAAGSMVSIHNMYYLLHLMEELHAAILEHRLKAYVKTFMDDWYGDAGPDGWVRDALTDIGVM